MVFGAKINENYESDAKELEKVVAAGILLCRTFFYSLSSHLRKRGRRGLGIILIFTSQSHSSSQRIEKAPSSLRGIRSSVAVLRQSLIAARTSSIISAASCLSSI